MTSGVNGGAVNGLRNGVDGLHINNGHASNGSSSSTTTTTKPSPRARLDRKASSPMMPAFMVSAPGKVIVFGEHAVVHGRVRLAPCLDFVM